LAQSVNAATFFTMQSYRTSRLDNRVRQ